MTWIMSAIIYFKLPPPLFLSVNHAKRRSIPSTVVSFRSLAIQPRRSGKIGWPASGPLLTEEHQKEKKLANKWKAKLERHTEWQKLEDKFKRKTQTATGRGRPTKPHMGNKLLVNGETTSDPNDVLHCWVEHYSHLLTHKQLPTHNW